MTKEEKAALAKLNLQKRALTIKQIKPLVIELVKAAYQPKINAVFKEFEARVVQEVEALTKDDIETYKKHIKPAILPIMKYMQKSQFNSDKLQNVHSVGVVGELENNVRKVKDRQEFGNFKIKHTVSYEDSESFSWLGFDTYNDLGSDSAGFDVSSLKIEMLMLATMSTSFRGDYNFSLYAGESQKLFLELRAIKAKYKKVLVEALEAAHSFKGIIESLKKPENIYLTLPEALPYLPKEEPKKKAAVNELIASGEAERLNDLLKKSA